MKHEVERFRINLIDLAILLYHVHHGAKLEDEVGFEDCERTLAELTEALSPKAQMIEQGVLESALWSANLLDELGEFSSPTGESFDEFVRRLLKMARPQEKYLFDKFYNLLRKRESAKMAQNLLDEANALRHPDFREDEDHAS